MQTYNDLNLAFTKVMAESRRHLDDAWRGFAQDAKRADIEASMDEVEKCHDRARDLLRRMGIASERFE